MTRYIDLFAGIGGFRYGIEKANKNTKCVYSNEWDKYANSVYRKHYAECDQTDIRLVRAYDIPDHDLLCGGFPCQSFSIAGKRGGFSDTRGTMFFEIARILKQKRPRLLLLENVKGLLSQEQGRTYGTILNSLDELGYDTQWQVLNSKNFGVPQNRERIYIVGHLRGTPRPEVFPLRGSNENTIQRNNQRENATADTITSRYSSRNGRGTHIRTDEPDTQQEGNKSNSTNSIRRKTYTDDMRIRRLTPKECERLQGFPDQWTQFGLDTNNQEKYKNTNVRIAEFTRISDTQRYKMCGNAVTTNVITAIAEKLL